MTREQQRVQRTGERIEELLAGFRGFGEAAAARAEELVRALVELYGDGLARIAATLRAEGEAGAAMLARLADDPLVESLLLLHGLHPLDVDARIQRALDRVRPYLGSHAGGVEYLGVTDGVARLRLAGSCQGCPSSTVTVRLVIEGAVREAAPEVNEVLVEGVVQPAGPELLQIGHRPDGNWVRIEGIGPPSARPVGVDAGGLQVLVCAVRGTLYAYRDACAACHGALAGGTLDREVLRCPHCGSRFDVQLAGRGVDDPALHLDPLPLLADSTGIRVAVPVVSQA
jgi:Fe-S cluster biogenesis protein NfuA/nitrite reductase/ring-hydroxylating ferredoxin subunit